MRMSIERRGVLTLVLLALVSPRARAATPASPEVIAVIAGANVGAFDDEPLHFAESDARRFRDLLIELGQLHAARGLLVIGGGPDQIVQALTEARGRAAELASTGKR